MRSAVARLYRVAPCLLVAVALAAVIDEVHAATLTTYATEDAFRKALGSTELSTVTFDDFEVGTLINDQIGGIVFSSPPIPSDGFVPLQIRNDGDRAKSVPNVLFGGFDASAPFPRTQIYQIRFAAGHNAVALYLTDYLHESSPVSATLDFSDKTSQTIAVPNNTSSDLEPNFFGVIADTGILGLRITATRENEAHQEIGVDNLMYADVRLSDTNPPVCSAHPVEDTAGIHIVGSASEFLEGDTGIQSVVLDPLSANLLLAFVDCPGPILLSAQSTTTIGGLLSLGPQVCFRLDQIDPAQKNEGRLVVTDGVGLKCTVPFNFQPLAQGPTTGKVLCTGEGLLFQVDNQDVTPPGTAVCTSSLPSSVEPPFPPGYVPTPSGDPSNPPCRVMTIDSPLSNVLYDTRMVLKKDGPFDPNLRLLFSESSDGGVTFPQFNDVTDSVEPIDKVVPDPTRAVGSSHWTPVKVTCALQSEPARVSYCDGLGGAPGPDYDGDGFTLCGSATSPHDCNDQRAFMNPGSPERCNGLDDDCDGEPDDGHPTLGADAPCIVVQDTPDHPPLKGACLQGRTTCADGPMHCVQTVFPVEEIACNGVDDDCDGVQDEAYVFSGYLAPIKSDGSAVFLKKRGAIPVKLALHDCAGAIVSNAVATIEVRFVQNGVAGDDVIDLGSVGKANTGNLYRYDTTLQQYVYNLDASGLQSNAVYQITTRLDDGTTHKVNISIK